MTKAGLNYLALILTVIGGINWGLIGLFDFNLVVFLFGFLPLLVKIVYVLVGVSACYMLYLEYDKM